ncbi:hypothetical protein [Nocardioides daejeonensis]|uniref:hypothetical protein n=1 Tax=Nocardioides daejeonensis TaxID=1046556 RepID=UPI000D74BB51|nr:hypothetical protein [Nocardioides daejeonensis]
MARHRATPPPRPEDDPANQPLWRGQLAPVEGAEPETARVRTPLTWRHPFVRILAGFLVIGLVTAGAILYNRSLVDEPLALDEIEAGMCLTSAGLRAATTRVDDLRSVSCDQAHDAEVFAILLAGSETTELAQAGRRCSEALAGRGSSLEEITQAGLEVRPLAPEGEISADTRVACFLRSRTGEKMTGMVVANTTEPHAED